mmetsp:Transcript_28473/g.61024  ORF Transcript_28473/g.61024 Transcript_28473/m.61024 type:complete len:206 (-) Transcript_28473:323-940(-)
MVAGCGFIRTVSGRVDRKKVLLGHIPIREFQVGTQQEGFKLVPHNSGRAGGVDPLVESSHFAFSTNEGCLVSPLYSQVFLVDFSERIGDPDHVGHCHVVDEARIADRLAVWHGPTEFCKICHGRVVRGYDGSSDHLAFHDIHPEAFHLRGMQANVRTLLVGSHNLGNVLGNVDRVGILRQTVFVQKKTELVSHRHDTRGSIHVQV